MIKSRIVLFTLIGLFLLSIYSNNEVLSNPPTHSVWMMNLSLIDDSDKFLNSTNVVKSPLANISRSDVANYSASIEFDPMTSNYNVSMQLAFRNPTSSNLVMLPLNHWLLSFTDAFLSSDEENDLGNYPSGFDNITLIYHNISVNDIPVNYSIVESHLELDLENASVSIPSGGVGYVSMDFSADVPKSARRYAKLTDGGYTIYAMPDILPLLPVYENGVWRADPFDFRGEPFYSESAFFNVSVTTPSDFVIGATGRLVSDQTSNGTRTRLYEAFPVRDWALVGSYNYSVAEQVVKLPSGRNVSVQSFYLDSAFGAEQLREGADSLKFYSKMTGVEYAYSDYVLAQVFNVFYGGMEYPQLVLDASSSDNVVAHETAHQWNWVMIGVDQPHETWLDEGLTSYWTDEYRFAKGRITRDQIGNYYNNIYFDRYVESPDIINETIYEAQDFIIMSYVKMPAVLHDLEHLIGEPLFKVILQNFYRENRFGIGKSYELVDTFAKALGKDWVRDYFDYFLNTPELPYYKNTVDILSANATHTVIELNITDFTPNIPQRIDLDHTDNNVRVDASIMFDGNKSLIWAVSSPKIESIYIDPLRQNLASYNHRIYYLSSLYPTTTETTSEVQTNSTSPVTSSNTTTVSSITNTNTSTLSVPETSPSSTKKSYYPVIGLFVLPLFLLRKKKS